MTPTIIIPARHASTRFPGKMLASETGWPLVRHAFEAGRRAQGSPRVVIATDDERIRDAATAFGAEAVMTSPDHPNGTSRLAEAADILRLGDDEIVVNVQGDEPELDPRLIDGAAEALRRSAAPVSTIGSPFLPGEDPSNPNIVKVVRRLDGTALYFSRALVPHNRDGADHGEAGRPLKHVGLYAYRRAFLRTYVGLAETPLESIEKLEQLRVLEHGHAIAVAVMRAESGGVDTAEQYGAFVARWRARSGRGAGAEAHRRGDDVNPGGGRSRSGA